MDGSNQFEISKIPVNRDKIEEILKIILKYKEVLTKKPPSTLEHTVSYIHFAKVPRF